MFLKRLSIAGCALMCFGSIVLGTNANTTPTLLPEGERNEMLAPLALPDFNMTYKPPTCSGGNDGSIIVNITVGTGPFKVEYKLSSSSSFNVAESNTPNVTIPIDGLSKGFYDIRVTDLGTTPNINETKNNFEVKDLSQLGLGYDTVNPKCSDGSGEITLKANGGDSSNYTYSLLKNGSTINPDTPGGNLFTGLSAGSYNATVVDDNGCPETENGLSIVIPDPIAPSVTINEINCPGENTTIILNNLPEDITSYQIKLNGTTRSVNISGTTATITNVEAGSYTLTVERPDCSTDNWLYDSGNSFDIEEFAAIDFTWDLNPLTNAVSVDCFGANVPLTVTLTGGKTGESVQLILQDRETLLETELHSALPIGDPLPLSFEKGKYKIIARIAACSYEKEQSFDIGGPSVPFELISLDPTNVTCTGGNNGTIKVNYSGGTGAISYTLDGGVSYQALPADNIIRNLVKDSYSVRLKDGADCESELLPVTINEPLPLNVTLDLTKELDCPNVNDGILTATTGGGTGTCRYTLRRSGAIVDNYNNVAGGAIYQFSGLSSGTYEVEVYSDGCSDNITDTETIAPVDPVYIDDPIYNEVECRNEQVTDFYVRASGGNGSSFTYSLKDTDGNIHPESPQTETVAGAGVTFNGLEPGKTYRIEASYGTCNPVTKDVTITNPLEFRVNYQSQINLMCFGGSTDITILASGEAPFEISEDGISYIPFSNSAENKHVLTQKPADTYNYYLRDAKGCEYNGGAPITINVVAPSEIFVTSLTAKPRVKCFGEANGIIDLKVTGGNAPYLVEIIGSGLPAKATDADGNVTFTKLAAGDNYDVRIIDDEGDGCDIEREDVFSVAGPTAPLELTAIVDKPLLDCFGDETLVEVTFQGGWPASTFTVNVSGGNNVDLDLSGPDYSTMLKKGTYTITVTDELNGCSDSKEITIDQPDQLLLTGVSAEDVSCFGENDASITFSVSGGTGPFYWGIDDEPINQIDAGSHTLTEAEYELAVGSYTLYVKDANNCRVKEEGIDIEEPTPVEFVFSDVDSVVCFNQSNGRIEVLATGGSGSYLYALDGDETRTEQTSREFRNLAAGEYSVNVRDSKGCAAVVNNQDTIIFQPQEIIIDDAVVSSAISCAGESDAVISITANGGEPYTGLQYRLSNTAYQNEPEIEGLDNGNYQVFVRDSRGKCETVWPGTITIADPAELVLLPAEVTNVSCHNAKDGKVKIQAEGGTGAKQFYLYKDQNLVEGPKNVGEFSALGDLSTTPNIDATVNYTIEVVDENNCSKTMSFSVVNPAAISIVKVAHRQVSCNGMGDGWITVNVEGGTGTYSFKQNDADASVTSNYTVESTNTFRLTQLNGGFYSPVVIDNNGCSDTVAVPVNIINPPKLVISDVVAGGKNCNYSTDDSTTIWIDENLHGSPGNYQYSIDGGTSFQNSELFINIRTHTIKPVVKDSMGCLASFAELEIEWPDAFTATLIKNEIRCWDRQYGTLSVEYDGGTAPYYLSVEDRLFADAIVTQLDESRPTTRDTIGDKSEYLFVFDNPYELYVKDHKGCYAENLNVSKTSDPVAEYSWLPADTLWLNSIEPTRPKCNGDQGTIQYSVDGGTQPYKYWVQGKEGIGSVVPTNQDDDGLVNVPTGINLYAYVSDYYNCKAKVPEQNADFLTTYIYPIHDTVKVEVDVVKNPYCPSTKDGRVTLEVTGFLKDGVRFHIYKHDTIYNKYKEVFFDQIFRDEATDSAQVSLPPEADSVNVKEWTYSVNHDTVAYKFTAGLYEVNFIDNITECDVNYQFELIADTSECDDVFPKIFTPNNDGQNDLWTVSQYEKNNVSLKIFTAYGELVYEFSGLVPEEGLTWDGLDLDERPVPAGTYMYIYNADVTLKKEHLEYGTVTILRNR